MAWLFNKLNQLVTGNESCGPFNQAAGGEATSGYEAACRPHDVAFNTGWRDYVTGRHPGDIAFVEALDRENARPALRANAVYPYRPRGIRERATVGSFARTWFSAKYHYGPELITNSDQQNVLAPSTIKTSGRSKHSGM